MGIEFPPSRCVGCNRRAPRLIHALQLRQFLIEAHGGLSMAIIDTILTTPVNVAGLRKEGKTLELQLDGAFSNLVNYASKNWQYTASGSTGGQALLDGSAKAAPGGGIATALKLVFINGLGVAEK